VPGVGVDDFNFVSAKKAAQHVHSARIHFECRRTLEDVERLRGGSYGQRLPWPCRDDRPMPPTRELGGEPECLAFPAPPTALGIDVKDAHEKRAGS